MKRITIFCLIASIQIYLLHPQTTADDITTLINGSGERQINIRNDITFDYGSYGISFDEGTITFIGNITDALANPQNTYSLEGTGAFIDIEENAVLNLQNIQFENIFSIRDSAFSNDGILNIENSIFSNNTNGQNTSVISNFGILNVDSSLFEQNSIDKTGNNELGLGRGGVIRNYGSAFINNSIFRDNAAQHGSAIYNAETGIMEITNSLFENNKSSYLIPESNDSSSYAYGTIFNQGTLIVRETDFFNNAMGSGGAIYNEGITSIYDSNFIGNDANGLGGAITNATGGTLNIHNSVFDANTSNSASAAINSAYGGNVNIIGSTIRNHSIISDADSGNYDRDNGGAMYFYGVEFLRDENYQLIFDKNGHAIVKTPSGHLYIENSQFINNTVSRGGGAVYSTGYATIINTLFENNSSDLKDGVENPDSFNAGTAGAFYDYNYTDLPTIIKGSTFRRNSAYSAGAIYHPAGHLIIDDTLFEYNSAIDVGGGGALMNGGVGSLVLTNSHFIENNAGLGGAFSQMSENSAYIANSYFEKNTANSYGGALYLRPYRNSSTPENVKSYTEIVNSDFVQNSSNGSGGAIYLQSDLDLSGSTFTENTANIAGGALFILGPSTATIKDIDFLGNRASDGGAIRNNGNITIYNSIFEENRANEGSAIMNNGTVIIYNSLFQNNVSTYNTDKTYYTAAGHVDGNGTTNIYNSSFLNNYHKSSNDFDYAAAITGSGSVNIIATDGVSLISGNISNGHSLGAAVSSDDEMHLYAGFNDETEGRIVFNDAIGIMYGGILHINRDNTQGFVNDGVIEINDEIKRLGVVNDNNYSVNLYNGTVLFGSATVNYDTDGDGNGNGDVTSFGSVSDTVTFNVFGGKISTADGQIRETQLGNLQLFSDALYDLDVDLNKAVSDRPTAASFVSNGYAFLIDTIHLFDDVDAKRTEVLVSDGSIEVALSDQTVAAYTPLYRYELDDSKLQSENILVFIKDLETYKGYNPSLYASTIALLTGNTLAQSNAISTNLYKNRSDSNFMVFVSPYISMENITLTDGYKVDSLLYGNDFEMSLHESFSLAVSYEGSYQSYEKTSMFQNGANIRVTNSIDMGNLFINTSVSTMGNYVRVNTMYGLDTFPIVSGGLGTNVGYEFTINDIFTLTTSALGSYILSKSFDYRTSLGNEIQNDLLHSVNVTPTFLLSSELSNDITLYTLVQGSFNFQFGGSVRVDTITLPSMKLGHSMHYAVGLEKPVSESNILRAELSGNSFTRSGLGFSFSITNTY